jgi:hypothetical protein
MRKTYETDGDLANEASIAKSIAIAFNCEVKKLNKFNQFDYAAIRNGKIVAFLEVKRRKCHSTKYKTIILSLTKVLLAHQIYSATNVETFFVVRWNDKTGICSIVDKFDVSIGGRVDRGDPSDIEPVCHINVGKFRGIK